MQTFRSVIFTTIVFFCVTPAVKAQTNVIVLEDVTEVTAKDADMVGVNRHLSVEILNDKGSDYASFDTQCSKGDKLVSFSGCVTDKEGRVLRKMKKSDLQTTAYSKEMSTDVVTTFFDYTPPTYPIIITYDWKEEISDGLIQYPMFFPQSDYGVEIKRASYRLSVPATIKCKYAERNTMATVKCTSSEGNNIYEVQRIVFLQSVKNPIVKTSVSWHPWFCLRLPIFTIWEPVAILTLGVISVYGIPNC